MLPRACCLRTGPGLLCPLTRFRAKEKGSLTALVKLSRFPPRRAGGGGNGERPFHKPARPLLARVRDQLCLFPVKTEPGAAQEYVCLGVGTTLSPAPSTDLPSPPPPATRGPPPSRFPARSTSSQTFHPSPLPLGVLGGTRHFLFCDDVATDVSPPTGQEALQGTLPGQLSPREHRAVFRVGAPFPSEEQIMPGAAGKAPMGGPGCGAGLRAHPQAGIRLLDETLDSPDQF